MANAILTSPFQGEIAQNTQPFDFTAMPNQALVAILGGTTYTLSYERNFDGLAPSLASAITAGSPITVGEASDTAQSLLLSTTDVNFNINTPQTLYTVPAGFLFLLYRIVVRNVSIDLDTMTASFGVNSPDFNNIILDGNYPGLTGLLYTTVTSKVGSTVGVGGNNFSMLCNTPQGAAATGIIDTFGYLVAV